MKTAVIIIFTFLCTTVYGQTVDYQILLDSAKTLFKTTQNLNQEELDKFDYYQVVSLLDKVIELNPQNSEARYFLGYLYSRINSRDARGMIAMNPEMLFKASEQFEKVIELSPKYSGEIILLDPYSKLTSEWGAMAMKYWFNNKADSAVMVFNEGKKRGGFGNFFLELNRNILDACSRNAILISSGDNLSFPLWYLQIAENYRTDVSIVDISLLNTSWYPAFLSGKNLVSFDLPREVLDTLEYSEWPDTKITINSFSWIVKPSYYDKYLLRGDKMFLSLLKQNKFQRDLYFTFGFTEANRLSLKNYLSPGVFTDKLSVSKASHMTYPVYKETITKALKLSEKLNQNSQDELKLFENFRYDIFKKVNDYLTDGDKKKARDLLELLDKFADEKKYPYLDEDGKKIVDYFRQKIM